MEKLKTFVSKNDQVLLIKIYEKLFFFYIKQELEFPME